MAMLTPKPIPENLPLSRLLGVAAVTLGVGLGLAACGSSGSPRAASTSGGAGATTPAAASSAAPSASAASSQPSQAPVPAESNPPGDIPDSTVYVTYRSTAGHLMVKVPEGWSRTTTAASSTFTSNLNSIKVAWTHMAAAPTVGSARASTIPALRASGAAFRLQSVRAVPLPGGPAVEITYQVNSAPNAVTGRRYRLVIERFELYSKGRGAVLSLSSAVGSDNVDPWRIVSKSFRWR
jgi:hypothetical protein